MVLHSSVQIVQNVRHALRGERKPKASYAQKLSNGSELFEKTEKHYAQLVSKSSECGVPNG